MTRHCVYFTYKYDLFGLPEYVAHLYTAACNRLQRLITKIKTIITPGVLMKYSIKLATGITHLCITLLLAACGGGGTSKAASSTPISSSAPSSIAPSSSSSSSIQTSSSSLPSAAKCTIDGKQWNVCTSASNNWSFEGGHYCIAQAYCPANRTSLPVGALRLAPIDPNANAKTQATFTYLRSIWGQKTLSGQQDLTWKDSIDMAGRGL